MTEQLPTTARDLMSPNPRSIQGGATVPEVLAFLTDTGFSAAPVIDDAGRTIGVVSRTDVVVYERGRTSQPVGAIHHHGVAGLEAFQYRDLIAVLHPQLDGALVGDLVR